MIRICFYAESREDLAVMKNYVENAFIDFHYTAETFPYPMDLLDRIHTDRPEHCMVFFDSSDPVALEMARKIHDINPKYRFNLFSEVNHDAELLYGAGVTFFVKKPFQFSAINRCTEHMIDFYADIQPRFITLKHRAGDEVYRYSEIKYFMSDKRKVTVCCDMREEDYYYKLDEIEGMLDSSFLRCHQSYIVNMKRIKLFLEDGVQLYDDTFIPVSRKKYFEVRRRYRAYVAGDQAPEM